MSFEYPPPMTPPECDLRDFPFMPLDVVRLRDSDMAAHQDAEVFRAALLAWCVAWHQVPAASLPDDDVAITRLIGMGRDVKGWKKLRAAGALDGFTLCADGRLYHDVVAEKAVKSWEAKKAQRDRTEKARLARLSQSKERSVTDTEKHHEPSVVSVTEASKGEVRESKGKGEYPHQESKKVVFSNFVVGRGGGKEPMSDQNKIALFQKWLATSIGRNGWLIVGTAADPTAEGYEKAVQFCRAHAKKNGKGWPHKWPSPAVAAE
jgi:hypothetical protein